MRGSRRPRALLVAACTWGVLLGPAAASAFGQGLEILSVAPGGADPTCASPCGSVQAAVNRAAQDLQAGAASSALIEVAPGFYSGNVNIPSIAAATPLTIQGAGPSTELGGTGVGSVVTVPAGSRVTITDLIIAGGNALQGGGIYNAGDLTLLRDTVASNTASDPPSGHLIGYGYGGGVFSVGALTVQDSTISGNRAAGSGAGIGVFGGTLNAARDAIVNNTTGPDPDSGGGLAVNTQSYCCTVTDSTIAGNAAVGSASAAAANVSHGGVRLYGDTIADNHSETGVGGLVSYFATIDIGGTLLAHNSVNCQGFITPNGGDLSDDSSCPTEIQGVDPQLQPLALNGGLTRTMAISASSPAYDANTLCDGTDQRQVSRRQLGATQCDIGAYQVSAPSTYVANTAAGSITAFAADATGNTAPTLTLSGTSTGLSKPTGVVVDVSGKVFVANTASNSITEYAPESNGNTAPTATIAGALTQLNQPQDLALDPQGDLFVTNANSVTEYAPGATGNVAPKARIAGSNTKLSTPRGIVVDSAGALHVTNGNGSVTTYAPAAQGNVAPSSKLTVGAGTGRPFGLNFDPHGNLELADAATSRVDTFSPTAAGANAPLRVLTGTAPALSTPVGLDLDLAGDTFIANRASNSVSEYAPDSGGAATPLATIAGPATGLASPSFLSELPPPPAPRVHVTTIRHQSRKQILRGGIVLKVRAAGTLAFRSKPIAVSATARAKGRIVAAARALTLRPGHVTLLLIPNRAAAHIIRGAHLAALTVVVTIRGAAGRQTHRLTVHLTR